MFVVKNEDQKVYTSFSVRWFYTLDKVNFSHLGFSLVQNKYNVKSSRTNPWENKFHTIRSIMWSSALYTYFYISFANKLSYLKGGITPFTGMLFTFHLKVHYSFPSLTWALECWPCRLASSSTSEHNSTATQQPIIAYDHYPVLEQNIDAICRNQYQFLQLPQSSDLRSRSPLAKTWIYISNSISQNLQLNCS